MLESNTEFAFAIGEKVTLALSGEQGIVTGRAEFDAAECSYYVRYKSADGRQVEAWWGQSAIKGKA